MAVLAAALLLLSACGGGSLAAPTPTPRTSVGAEAVIPGATGVATPTTTPGDLQYTVVSGDTLGAIAERFGVSVDAISLANNITEPTDLHVGDVLIIPGVKATAVVSRTPPPSTTSTDSPIGMVLSLPLAGSCLTPDDTQMPNSPREYRSGVHEGVDFFTSYACVEVPKGAQVLAAGSGTVIRADQDYRALTQKQIDDLVARSHAQGYTDEGSLDKFRGRQLWIDHGGGIVTRYCHLAAIQSGIEVGTHVNEGQIVGFTGDSGTPGSASNPDFEIHLHFEIRVGDTYLGKGLDSLSTRNIYERVFGMPLTTPAPEAAP